MYSPKIAIIIPTIHRDQLLMQVINSIIDRWDESWKVFIIDQNNEEDYSEEKKALYKTICTKDLIDQRIEVIKVKYDSGISVCRNTGVEYAVKQNIPYCLISADSIEFTDSMKDIGTLCKLIDTTSYPFDLIGLDLINRKIGWEAKLNLVENSHFELDFIEKRHPDFIVSAVNVQGIYKCDIVRNFFLATTESLDIVKWDAALKMCEHEDFFWAFKQAHFNVGWTDMYKGKYVGQESKTGNSLYGKLRTKNWSAYKKFLMIKYNLKKWVIYKNLERAQDGS